MRWALRFWALVGAVLALPGAVREARAETGAAEALFRAGRDAAKRGDHEVACAKFAESERLEPAVGTELNLALCEEQLQHLLPAWRLFGMVVDKLPEGDSRRLLARRHFESLDARVPRITLRATALPSSAVIRQGSTRLTPSSLGVAIPVEVGDVELVVIAPGRTDKHYRLSLAEGARETLQIEAGELVFRPPAAPAPVASPLRSGAVMSMGLGAALIAVGGATGLAVINAKESVERECDANGACTPRGVAAAHRGETLSLVSTASFAAGVGCVGVGAWLWLQTRASKPARLGFDLGPGQVAIHGQF